MSELTKWYWEDAGMECGTSDVNKAGGYLQFDEAEKYYNALLVEKDKEIIRLKPLAANGIDLANLLQEAELKLEELERLFAIQQTRMDKATKLWQQATGKTETLPDLGDLLDWLMERGTEAERVHREMIDLLEVITGESNETYPEMAVTDAVRLLKREKEEAEGKLKVLETEISEYRVALAEAERKLKAMVAKDKFWWKRLEKTKANLKTATDALKDIRDSEYPRYGTVLQYKQRAGEAIADIGGKRKLPGFKDIIGLYKDDEGTDSKMIDYQALLKKYIKLVATEEGVTFIDDYLDHRGFSDEEVKELLLLEKKIYDEWENG